MLIIPEKMESKIGDISGKMRRVVSVKQGAFYEVDGLEFDTVAAYNTLKPFHTKGAGWVGYILRIDRKAIYIAGDTDVTKEAKTVKCDIILRKRTRYREECNGKRDCSGYFIPRTKIR